MTSPAREAASRAGESVQLAEGREVLGDAQVGVDA